MFLISEPGGTDPVTVKADYYENFDLTNVVTPVNFKALRSMLEESSYDKHETEFLVNGFQYGFDIGYHGDTNIRQTSHNLRLRIGNHTVFWNKIMKEVKNKRYAGPFRKIHFEYYLQLPVGLVPKDNGWDARLIFHLSHPWMGQFLNSETPKFLTSVKYCDFSDAVRACMKAGVSCHIAKSDMTSAFRNLGIKLEQWFLLILKAVSPIDGETYYFVDKCLPFGAAISCSHFQRFSDCTVSDLEGGTNLQTTWMISFLLHY